jgi:GNAT superfamily N-acetyltransferase
MTSSIITKKRKNVYLILELELDGRPVSKIICIYPEWDTTVMLIADINTESDYRYKGYASQLIRRAIWEARRNGCKHIRLDDCTDAFNSDHNIYIKNGFTYERSGLPEMVLYL